ncbi:MAG TPA: hypothetical protein VFD01_17360 [Candidatus Dormibacteraeota bacterium]|nr:hypothetical protein [Candidatus Dormibacteraeota bacterium]
MSGSPIISPDGRWRWDGGSWVPIEPTAPRVGAPEALPHVPDLLRAATRHRSQQVRPQVVLAALVIAFGLYLTASLWREGAPLLAVPLGCVVLLNGAGVVLGALQAQPLVRIEPDGVWLRKAWAGLWTLRLIAGLGGVVLAAGCALLLWWVGMGGLGLFLLLASLLNAITRLAQPVPAVRLATRPAQPVRWSQGGPAGRSGRWVFIPWSAIRQVRSGRRFGLATGITLEVDPVAWREATPRPA